MPNCEPSTRSELRRNVLIRYRVSVVLNRSTARKRYRTSARLFCDVPSLAFVNVAPARGAPRRGYPKGRDIRDTKNGSAATATRPLRGGDRVYPRNRDVIPQNASGITPISDSSIRADGVRICPLWREPAHSGAGPIWTAAAIP